MARCLTLTLAAVLVAVPAFVGARQSQEGTFRGGTHTVSIYATVLDRSGRLAPDLTQDDFFVFDNGVPQELTVFRNDVQPITIVVMLDRSGSMVGNFTVVRDAAEQFVGDLLPDDKARIGSFADRIQIDPPQFTSDKNELIRILHYNLQDSGPTPLWNATNVAMNALKHQEGRRVVLMFTDGYDSPDRPSWRMTLDEVIRQSQTDEVMVYAIGLADSCPTPAPRPAPLLSPGPRYQRGRPGGHGPRMPPGGGMPRFPPPGGPVGVPGGGGRYPPPGGRTPDIWNRSYVGCSGARPDPGLQLLADEAGGGYFELHHTDDLASTFARVADELHHQYLLGFTATAHDGKLHNLEVRLRDSSMTARARRSYLAPSGDRASEERPDPNSRMAR